MTFNEPGEHLHALQVGSVHVQSVTFYQIQQLLDFALIKGAKENPTTVEKYSV
jgi:hypothetical protein